MKHFCLTGIPLNEAGWLELSADVKQRLRVKLILTQQQYVIGVEQGIPLNTPPCFVSFVAQKTKTTRKFFHRTLYLLNAYISHIKRITRGLFFFAMRGKILFYFTPSNAPLASRVTRMLPLSFFASASRISLSVGFKGERSVLSVSNACVKYTVGVCKSSITSIDTAIIKF